MKNFTKKPLRIAICISGQLRHWDLTSKLFECYNKINPDVQYDFFISTWDDIWEGNKYDLSKSEFITKYELVDPDSNLFQTGFMQSLYTLKRVHELRNKHEVEFNVKYDAVFTTRSDIYISLNALDVVNVICNTENHEIMSSKIIYTVDSSVVHVESNGDVIHHEYFIGNDGLYVGHPNALDIYSNIYDDLLDEQYIDNFNQLEVIHNGVTKSYKSWISSAHTIPPIYMLTNGIVNRKLSPHSMVKILKTVFTVPLYQLVTENRISELYETDRLTHEWLWEQFSGIVQPKWRDMFKNDMQ